MIKTCLNVFVNCLNTYFGKKFDNYNTKIVYQIIYSFDFVNDVFMPDILKKLILKT